MKVIILVLSLLWPADTAPVLDQSAVVYRPAVRLGVVESPLPAAGLHGLPFAPEGLSDCDEMNFYRVQAGLPDQFARIGWRESNCRNEEGVKTFCCYGYWQMYFTQHRADHRMRPRYDACEIFAVSDYNGDEPLDKQKQACAAKALFDVAGMSPWAMG